MPERTDEPVIVLPAPRSEGSRRETYPERRDAYRFPFSASADVTDVRSQAHVLGRTSDFGPGGCYVDTLCPLQVGALVHIRVERELREFQAAAVVTYALASMGMGMAFTDVKPEHQAVLQVWLDELNGERQAAPEAFAAGPRSGMLAATLNLRQVINELINLMVRKKTISENEAAGLLRQMFR